VILGPLMETYFLRAMKMSQGDIMVIFSSNIGNTLWVLLVISMALPYFMDYRRDKKAANG
jgi:putative tricarboxylic transport membrane protein